MTRERVIEILTAELAKSEQMSPEHCRRWIERGFAAVDAEEALEITYDPPSGWKYGFPRAYLPLEGETLEQTLVRDGYPQAMVDKRHGEALSLYGQRASLGEVVGMKSWDSIARAYVERGEDEDMAMTTFGPLKAEWAPILDMPTCGEWVHYSPGAPSTTPRADRRQAYITTYRGRFYPFAPDVADVNIEDIAHSLSMQCRYAGHGRRFYSVAEHCVHVAQSVPREDRLAALLHDSTEAYLVDVPRPVKAHLAGYKDIEASIWSVIVRAFGLSAELPASVHEADSRIIADEMGANLHEVDPSYTNPLGIRLQFWSPDEAETKFLEWFYHLMAVRRMAA